MPMSRLSGESEEKPEFAGVNDKTSARQASASTPEAKAGPRSFKEQISESKLRCFYKKDSTEHYQNAILRLNPRKLWKKRDDIKNNSRGLKAVRPKVLIVEDNQFNVLPMQTILKRNHIEFDWAKNGLMAVDKYEQAMKDS